MNVEQSLRALAADDETAPVPPHVDAAVMAAWDESGRAYHGRERATRRRQVALGIALALVGAIAVSLVAVAVVVMSRVGNQAPRTLQDIDPEKSIAPGVPDVAAGAIAPPRGVELPTAPLRRRRPSAAPARSGAAYVLVPDAETDVPLTMMRVRMPRSAFSRLGVPIANPDGDGMVDVEVLVGEDGVARSIRRATAVGWVDAN